MLTVLMLILLLVGLGLVFAGLVFPLWMIFSCLFNRWLGVAAKFLWCLVMVFTWPLGSFFYGLFGSRHPAHRAIVLGVVAAFTGILLCIYFGLNWSAAVLRSELNRNLLRLQSFIAAEISEESLASIRNDIVRLKDTVDELGKDVILQLRMIERLSLLEDIIEDGRITPEEYMEWKSYSEHEVYAVPKSRNHVQQYWQDFQRLERWERIRDSI